MTAGITPSSGHNVPAGLLCDDEFNSVNGFCGWVGLRNGPTPSGSVLWPPPTLVPEARSGAGYGLKLFGGTGSLKQCWAVKRLSRWDGVLEWEMGVAWNTDITANDNFLRFIHFAIDYQDGNNRYWFAIRYTHWDESGAVQANKWSVETGNADGASVITDIPGAVYKLGLNDWKKQDFFKVALAFDTKLKKYVSLRINDTSWDLSAYGPAPSNKLIGFENGMNLIVISEGRSNQGTADPYVIIDHPRARMR